MKKIKNILVASLLVLSTPAFAGEKVMTCSDFAMDAMEAAGFTWKDGVAIGSAALAGAAGGILSISSSAAMPMEYASPGMKAFVYGAIAAGIGAGALVGYWGANVITSNRSDILSLEDEVMIGSGMTLTAFTNSVLMDYDNVTLIRNGDALVNQVKVELADILAKNPKICHNTDSDEVLVALAKKVRERLKK